MVFRVQAAFYRESCRIKVQAAFIVLRTRRWGIPPESAGMAAQRHANRPDTAILQKKQPAHPDSPNAGCFFHRQTLCFRSPQGMTPPYPRTLPTIFAAVIKKQPALGKPKCRLLCNILPLPLQCQHQHPSGHQTDPQPFLAARLFAQKPHREQSHQHQTELVHRRHLRRLAQLQRFEIR